MAFIAVSESDGSFVGSTRNYSSNFPVSVPPNSAYYREMSSTNDTELTVLQNYIKDRMGGFKALQNVSQFTYNSPQYGQVSVVLNVYSYTNRDWYVYVVWPNSIFQKTVNDNVGVNIGVAAAVIIVSTLFALFLNIPITRNIYQLRQCFARIQRMDLDAPVIKKTLAAWFINYETNELRKSFESMLYTLRSFQKYVPPHIVQNLLEQRKEAQLSLENKLCTVMFLDIKDFTSHSERLSPQKLVMLMSEAFEGLSSVISSSGMCFDLY